tara:strand:- start:1363 stop:2283 length:921 start_codon:yes stop_codon:yes gene_type:complete
VKILVISSNLIGDTILSTGVIEEFSKKYPNAKFTFILGPSAAQIYKNFPATENIIIIKKKNFNLHWLEMYKFVWKKKWEIIIDLRSSIISYFLLKKKKYIFKKYKNLNHVDQLRKSFNLNNLSLIIHTSKNENNEAIQNINKKFKHIIIFPGGNWIPKIWPIDYYNKLINLLNNNFSNLKFIIVGSLEEKKIYSDKLKKGIADNIFIDLMGRSLTLTSAYMKHSNLFIGNDSGLMHLSVASNLKTLALFGPTNDNVYGHKNSNSFIVRTSESYKYFSDKSLDEKKSYMLSIDPKKVFDMILKNNLL